MNTQELQSSPAPSRQPAYTAVLNDLVIEYSPPNSLDLAAAGAALDADAARTTLLHRSVQRVSKHDEQIPVDALPGEAAEWLAEEITNQWPLAEIRLSLQCPECNHQWQPLFDISTYFWAEIESQSMRIIENVHRLARAYGWSEGDILSMSSTRRRFYLDMVG